MENLLKKNLFAAVAALMLLNALSCGTTKHSPENTSAWAGTYTGVIPSAGGEGINARITLNTDKTYTVEYQYIGKSDEVFTRTGTFNWNPEGDTVIMDSEKEGDFPSYYKLGENTLTQLDLTGNLITGEFANDYVLKKQQ
jgi:uncharacterized lipoprotein NlpE involved in copper resistance